MRGDIKSETTKRRYPIPRTSDELPTELDRYEVIEEIARGGMSIVFKVRDQQLNRVVAMKVLKEGEDADSLQV